MTNRDAFFAVAVLAFSLSGMVGIAVAGQASIGGSAVQAQAVGFDALANRMFGDKACTIAEVQ